MRTVSHRLGKDGEESYIEVYFMDEGLEIASHEFADYDSAHEVLNVSYKMFEKMMDTYTFYKNMRDTEDD